MSAFTQPELSGDRGFLPRLALGLIAAAAVTLLLFWVMQYLIATADRSLDEAKRGSLLDFVRVKRAEVVERKQTKPDKPPPPKAPPPEPPAPQLDKLKPTAEKIAVGSAPVESLRLPRSTRSARSRAGWRASAWWRTR